MASSSSNNWGRAHIDPDDSEALQARVERAKQRGLYLYVELREMPGEGVPPNVCAPQPGRHVNGLHSIYEASETQGFCIESHYPDDQIRIMLAMALVTGNTRLGFLDRPSESTGIYVLPREAMLLAERVKIHREWYTCTDTVKLPCFWHGDGARAWTEIVVAEQDLGMCLTQDTLTAIRRIHKVRLALTREWCRATVEHRSDDVGAVMCVLNAYHVGRHNDRNGNRWTDDDTFIGRGSRS